MNHNEQTHYLVSHFFETSNKLIQCLIKHPEVLPQVQFAYWHDYLNLCKDFEKSQEQNVDKRFRDPQWQQQLFFNFIKNTYLLLSQHIEHLITQITVSEPKKVKKQIQFYVRQILDAFAPSNFIHTNPEVLAKVFETKGANLAIGMKQFLQDLSQGKSLFAPISDCESFQLGQNLAATPGKVIYQNDVMQLIHYQPTATKVYERPLLIIPPWINKYYILDLQADNSFVRWLVDQGIDVFMISWVNATSVHKDKSFFNYLTEGPLQALKIIESATQAQKVNLLGYCVGGTLLGCLLAYLAKKKDPRIGSATFLTTLLDFSEPGELGVFIDEAQIKALEKNMKLNGYLDGNMMAAAFTSLRANDLMWSSFINHYLKGEKPQTLDFLYWNADASNIPAKVHSFYLRTMYLNNHLIEPNKVKMGTTTLNLSKIETPSYFLATRADHIVPWQSCYKSSQTLTQAPVKFVLAGSGHVAGVVNPPHKNKYGYWTAIDQPYHPEQFVEQAKFSEGSWWLDWISWLKHHSGELAVVKQPKRKNSKTLEPAPGSYVQVRINATYSPHEVAR